jgi:hypothetical protein
MELLGEKNPSSSMMELNDGTTGIKRNLRPICKVINMEVSLNSEQIPYEK